MRAYLKAILFALAVIVAAPAVSYAGDSTVVVTGAPEVNGNTVIIEQSSILPPPEVRYGCKRIWRCDSVVCEWRRGCFGTYGYMEGPYYTLEAAKRQWERHGWSTPLPRSGASLSSK